MRGPSSQIGVPRPLSVTRTDLNHSPVKAWETGKARGRAKALKIHREISKASAARAKAPVGPRRLVKIRGDHSIQQTETPASTVVKQGIGLRNAPPQPDHGLILRSARMPRINNRGAAVVREGMGAVIP